ncbi:hypothetical protein AN643_02195 [Candidatus Epulonipiscioides saccharophilum]|nr:hypothetical protein AN643_02195 [Epulopiscium sp. SCG-B10WGA-EpuloB]
MRNMKNSISFEKKLILTIIVTLLIPIIISIILMYNIWQNMLYEKINEYLEYVAENTIIELDKIILDTQQLARKISEEDIINSYLEGTKSIDKDSVLTNLKQNILFDHKIDAIYLIGKNISIIDYVKDHTKSYINLNVIESYRQLPEGWYVKQHIPFYIKDAKNDKGKFIIEINKDAFYDTLKDIYYKQAKEVFLINNLGQLIASNEGTETGQIISKEYQEFLTKRSSVYENIISAQSHIIFVSEPLCNGWKLIFSTPKIEYLGDILFFQYQMIASIFIITIAGLLIIVYVSKQLTHPLKDLAKQMSKFGQGDLDSRLEIKTQDEIATLNHTFNQMVVDMKKLIESEYEQKVLKQNAEIKSLQMQINPHFLYNTLDTINWLARMHGMDDVGDITASLGRLMRYSLSKKKYIQIKEEIEHLKDYVEIQEVRYGDRVSVIFEVDEELEIYYIPKLLIQPIVENAIVHGIEGKLVESTVSVRVEKLENDIAIIIEDDGVGIEPEIVNNILLKNEGLEKEGRTSLGIRNVNQRIQMVYGKEYGMQIDSILGIGTKITLRIKKEVK